MTGGIFLREFGWENKLGRGARVQPYEDYKDRASKQVEDLIILYPPKKTQTHTGVPIQDTSAKCLGNFFGAQEVERPCTAGIRVNAWNYHWQMGPTVIRSSRA